MEFGRKLEKKDFGACTQLGTEFEVWMAVCLWYYIEINLKPRPL